MNANELRLGNIICTVAPCGVIDLKTVDADILYIISTRCNKYEPVEVTEEILLKLGFVEYYRSDWRVKYELKDFPNISFDVNFTENEKDFRYKGSPIDVKHVHHLQNLVFEITRTELKI